jgi:transposase
MAVGKSDSAIGGFFRRLKARLGSPKAITATTHKLARIFYHLWTTRKPYHDVGATYYEQQYQQRKLQHLRKQSASLGFDLVEQSCSHPLVEDVS